MLEKIKDILRKPYRKAQSILAPIDFVPSGHFYSPIASKREILEGIKRKNFAPEALFGIDLNLENQLKLLEIFQKFYAQMPFGEEKTEGLRYYFNNPAYCHSDGICLYSMMRHFKPRRIIEVGSGFSSALMHDINDLFFRDSRVNRDSSANQNSSANLAKNSEMGGGARDRNNAYRALSYDFKAHFWRESKLAKPHSKATARSGFKPF